MMEVCRRAGDFTASPAHHQAPPAPQPPPPTSLVANFVPTTNGSAVTFTFNNQLTNQVQRLVREHRTAQTGYDNLVRFYIFFLFLSLLLVDHIKLKLNFTHLPWDYFYFTYLCTKFILYFTWYVFFFSSFSIKYTVTVVVVRLSTVARLVDQIADEVEYMTFRINWYPVYFVTHPVIKRCQVLQNT